MEVEIKKLWEKDQLLVFLFIVVEDSNRYLVHTASIKVRTKSAQLLLFLIKD